LLVGIIGILMQRIGWLGAPAAGALGVVITIGLITAVILITASTLNTTDRQRQEADRKLFLLAKQLRIEANRADDANRSKSQFLANMSHEIRTPLNGVLGMLFLLEQSGLSREQAGYARTIRQSADALLAIINDVIDVSKIEAGKMQVESIEFDPKQIVVEVARLFVMVAQEKGVSLRLSAPWGTPCAVLGDPVRFRQIANNLVSNAIKFTKEGSVTLELSVDRDADSSQFVLSVSDTGVGIPAERLANVFETFVQADGTTTRQFGGSGLGLAITRQLVELMGGEISVMSQVGRGSRFEVRLTRPTVGAPFAERPLRNCRCVVVEPNNEELELVSSMLFGMGAYVSTFSTIADAQSAVGAADIIFVSQRAHPSAAKWDLPSGRRVLLVPLGQVLDKHEESALKADAIVSVPAGEDDVRHAAAGIMPSEEVEEVHTLPLDGVRILLAEDNSVNQLIAEFMLQSLGAEIEIVENGLEAVHRIESSEFDVVLLDCHMPEMDGFEAAQRIRGQFATLPILALTASGLPEDRARCTAAGMNGFILKPMSVDDLRIQITRAMGAEIVTP